MNLRPKDKKDSLKDKEDVMNNKPNEKAGGSRVGEEFQAEIPDCCPDGASENTPERETLMWCPVDLSDTIVDQFVKIASNHRYSPEQALAMLHSHNGNVDNAMRGLSEFTQAPDSWSLEENVLFEQAYTQHGKNFAKIQLMLPHKSMRSLVEKFYSLKKKRNEAFLGERPDDSNSEGKDRKQPTTVDECMAYNVCVQESEAVQSVLCSNCKHPYLELCGKDSKTLCNDCLNSWRRNKHLPGARKRKAGNCLHSRPTPLKHRRHPPKGMHLDSPALFSLVTMEAEAPAHTASVFKALTCNLVSLKGQVQTNKKILEAQKRELGSGVEKFRPAELPIERPPYWTQEEILLVMEGLRHHGKDFEMIADTVGTKQEKDVRDFFFAFRQLYHLDLILAEHQKLITNSQ